MGRPIGRRNLIIAGAAGFGALVAACAAPPAPTSTAPAPAGAPAKAQAPAPAPTTAHAPAAPPSAAVKRSGTLKLLYWQAPTILNPHLAVGTKDTHAARICCEPLTTLDAAGTLVPVLAAEVPSKANGGLSEDGKSVTYKLKKDLKWADGKPFTADDVVFTYQFITDKETASTSAGTYASLQNVEALDPYTVKLTFKNPSPAWYVPFLGESGLILPKHALEDFAGARAREAPFNHKAFGTGPYKVESFAPGDAVIYKPNPHYREPGKPYFDELYLKGGGDAAGAARAVLQTGDFDFAWNLLVEWPVLQEMVGGGKGDLIALPGAGLEQIFLNLSDPNTEVDGEKSSLKTKHPFLADKRVREALALAVDRATIAKQLYGDSGVATSNLLTMPAHLASTNTGFAFDLERANRILDDAGYKRGGNGTRTTPDGKPMKMLFSTSVNALRQKAQVIVKDGWTKIGLDVELRAVEPGTYFASDPGKPETIFKFYWDAAMYGANFSSPYPGEYMITWYSGDPARDVAQKANNWAGANRNRWVDDEYNRTYDLAVKELDPEKSRALWIKLNDLVVENYVNIPLIDRKRIDAYSKTLIGPRAIQFDSDVANIADWRRR
jgi:peptide/nickel transport system substrate-binding protein